MCQIYFNKKKKEIFGKNDLVRIETKAIWIKKCDCNNPTQRFSTFIEDT